MFKSSLFREGSRLAAQLRSANQRRSASLTGFSVKRRSGFGYIVMEVTTLTSLPGAIF